jgi:hypothetical protein
MAVNCCTQVHIFKLLKMHGRRCWFVNLQLAHCSHFNSQVVLLLLLLLPLQADPQLLLPSMLHQVQDLQGLFHFAVNMQHEDAAVQLLQHVIDSPASSSQLVALRTLLQLPVEPGDSTDLKQQHKQQQQQQQQQSEAFISRLLQVALVRGHCKLAQRLALLPAAAQLSSLVIELLLQQVVQLYAAPNPAAAAASEAMRSLLLLPGAACIGPSAVAALMKAAVGLQDTAAADRALADVISVPSAHDVATGDFVEVAEAAIQAELICTFELLQLTPVVRLSPQQLVVLLHAVVWKRAVHHADTVLEAAMLLCEAPAALDVGVDAAAELLLADAQLGCWLLPTLCGSLPAAQLLPPEAVQQLLLCALKKRDLHVTGCVSVLAAARQLSVGQVKQLLTAAQHLGCGK